MPRGTDATKSDSPETVAVNSVEIHQTADADLWVVGPDWRLNLTQLKRDHDAFRQALLDIEGWENWQTDRTWRDIAREALGHG